MNYRIVSITRVAIAVAGVAAVAGCGGAHQSTAPAATPARHSTTAAPMLTLAQADAKAEGILRKDGFTPFRDMTDALNSNGLYQGWALGFSSSGAASGTQYELVVIACCGDAAYLVPMLTPHAPAGIVIRSSGDVIRVDGNAGQMNQFTVSLASPGPTAAAAPSSSTPSSFQGDPTAGSGTGPPCTTVPGYFPGGLPGHKDASGFCVPDKS